MKSLILNKHFSNLNMNYVNSKSNIDHPMIKFSSEFDKRAHTHAMDFFRKKEILAQTRQKHEDLEFQLMELETRCEAELEQAENNLQNEQHHVTQNSKLRQVRISNNKIVETNRRMFSLGIAT